MEIYMRPFQAILHLSGSKLPTTATTRQNILQYVKDARGNHQPQDLARQITF